MTTFVHLCLSSDFPIRGMQIYDGPINVQNCTFRKYTALNGRHTSAFGFRLNNSWQSCPNNNVTNITFDHVPVSPLLCEIHKTRDTGLTCFYKLESLLHLEEKPTTVALHKSILKYSCYFLLFENCIPVPLSCMFHFCRLSDRLNNSGYFSAKCQIYSNTEPCFKC